jgi:CBS domain-containing protein
MLPEEEVGQHMTADPVVVTAETDIRSVARLMLDAHIHRVGVVDEANRLVGIISSTDLLAALAYSGGVV